MALDVLAQGKLTKAPEQRTASNGRAYALAQVSVAMEEGDVLAGVIAFEAAAVAALLALDKADAVAVAGRAKVGVWQPLDGGPRPSLSITADAVLSVYAARKKRRAVQGDGDDADDRTPPPAPDRRLAARHAGRSGISTVTAASTGGLADMADDVPLAARQ